MKILLINSQDTGGAANACLRLQDGFKKAKVKSEVLLLRKSKMNECYYKFTPSDYKQKLHTRILNRVKHELKGLKIIKTKRDNEVLFKKVRNTKLEFFSFPDTGMDITISDHYKNADIINLHWVSEFLDYSTFFKKNTKPVVWTLHDMNPFTGGEHYKECFIGMNKLGKPEERVVTDFELKIFHEVLKTKKQALEGCDNLHIVTLCSWMTKEVKKSELFSGFPVYQIPNGIDSAIFNIRNKEYSRKLIDVPLDKKVILFAAESVGKIRKGFIFLQDALRRVKNTNFILVAVGNMEEDLESMENVIALGSISDPRLMSVAYSAADVFIIPSLMDNLPNTVIESLMCGTPVIGFPVGGITDMIENGVNGYLTHKVSSSALADSINKFLEKPDKFNSNEIRVHTIKKYDLSIQVEAYMKLFNQILSK